jgi:two-component system, cell cycle sensor histidine kinase and response regulator CckA
MTTHTARPIEILLVEDSPTDRLIAVEALKDALIINNMHTVENGVEAMAYLRRVGKYAHAARPDVILLDLNLPRKDGREVLLEIKNDDLLKFIPVVVLTTSDAEDDIISSYGHHANSFIKKPVDFSRFSEIVRSIGNYWFQIVTLPGEDAVRRAMRQEPPRVPAPPANGSQPIRVLLVEDDPASVLLVRDLLRPARGRFEIESVGRISELRRRTDLGTFNIVLTDLGLPDSQGLETYRRVRSCVNGRPIIVLTGLHDETIGVSAVQEGAQDYLIKGEMSHGSLARAVRYAVDRRNFEEHLRQSQRLEAIGQLAAGVAHDFNNILTVIQGQSLLLGEADTLTGDERAAVREITEATERAGNLTRQLLTFSRQQIMHTQVVNVNDVLGGIAPMLRRLLGPVSLEIQLTAERAVVEADLSMLEQVIMNLALNARDAMPGGGKLTVSTACLTLDRAAATAPEAYPGRFVTLTVSDTGSGIAPDVLPRIFEPFFTTKEVGKGSGLGLATVFSVAQQHRGWIQVSSELRRGTRFDVYLPASTAEPPSPGARPPAALGGHETILVVEDEPGVRRVAEEALRRKGYRVLSARSGVEALRVWDEHGADIDLLFTDLVMPDGVGGQQLAATLRGRRPDLPVVFTSGYSNDFAGGGTALREGRNFLQKPYTLTSLAATLRACLDRQEKTRDRA